MKCSIVFVLALVPVVEVDGQTSSSCTDSGASTPCAASLTGPVASTIIAGSLPFYPSASNVYGPFEDGFTSADDSTLTRLCGNSGVSNSLLYSNTAGVDVYTAEQRIAATCSTQLPRVVNNEHFGILDRCGFGSVGGFQENMGCLYENAATGHSPAVAEVRAATDGVQQRLYGKWEDYNPASSTYVLPAVDACNGHFGVTPDSNGAAVYHYHTTDLPPFTVGCFGPAKSAEGQDILVSPTTCRGLYTGSDGCGGGDEIRVTTPTGSRNYDPWCPCWSGLSNVEGGESPSTPPSPPVPSPSPPPPSPVVSPSPEGITQSINLNAGWTWISSPLFEGPVGTIIGDLDGLANDASNLIKDQYLFTNYIPGFGWFGQLSTLSPTSCYKLRLLTAADGGSPGVVTFSGTPSDLSATTISLSAGWTWLGVPSTTALPVSHFVDTVADSSVLGSDDRIKSQYQFTSYIPGFGWFGDLSTFQPGYGYMVKTESTNTLTGFGVTSSTGRARQLETAPAALPGIVGSGSWQLTPSTFEHSMGIVAVVTMDGTVAEDGDLAAFVNGELRGVARPTSYKAPVGAFKGHKSYNLMAFGELETEGATVTFQYRHGDGRVSELAATTAFGKDKFVGTLLDPFVIAHSTAASTHASTTNEVPAPPVAAIPAATAAAKSSTGVPAMLIAGITAGGAATLLLIALFVRRASAVAVDAKSSEVLPAKMERQPSSAA